MENKVKEKLERKFRRGILVEEIIEKTKNKERSLSPKRKGAKL